MKRGAVPIRQCIGCRARRPQAEFIRLKAQGDTVVAGASAAGLPGRSCYVCPTLDCVRAALKRGRLSRALHRSTIVPPSEEDILRGRERKG